MTPGDRSKAEAALGVLTKLIAQADFVSHGETSRGPFLAITTVDVDLEPDEYALIVDLVTRSATATD